MRSTWTAERIDQLKDMRLVQGMGYRKIAGVLGMAKSSVIGKARRMGLPREISHAPKPEKPPAPVVVPEVEPSPLTTLLAVGYGECRYPRWQDAETGAPHYPVCGHIAAFGSVYCAFHAARSSSRGTASERAARHAPQDFDTVKVG